MKLLAALAITIAVSLLLLGPHPHAVRRLPAGAVEVESEIQAGEGVELAGDPRGTVLRASPRFSGRAVVVVTGNHVLLRDFTVDGNRQAIEIRSGLPPSNESFARFTKGNGILAENVSDLRVERVRLREIAGFAVLVSHGHDIAIDNVQVTESGSRTASGRNNATGGILLEEGTQGFAVTRCRFRNIRGNGLWTHSLYTSARNARGWFLENYFENLGRDALQVGHATAVRVERNAGRNIGYPLEDVDMEQESLAVPVGIDTAGNVDESAYAFNRFEEINGKCIDLDGFHDGEIRGNECINGGQAGRYRYGNYAIVMNNSNPDMQARNIRIVDNRVEGALFGGIFVIGTGHRITGNLLFDLNLAHCNEEAARFGCYYAAGEPDMLRSGIYLGRGAHRPAPARDNRVEGNRITGFHMDTRCIAAAPGILPEWNTVRANTCRAE